MNREAGAWRELTFFSVEHLALKVTDAHTNKLMRTENKAWHFSKHFINNYEALNQTFFSFSVVVFLPHKSKQKFGTHGIMLGNEKSDQISALRM